MTRCLMIVATLMVTLIPHLTVADSIGTVFPTGVNEDGSIIVEDAINDPHYDIILGPFGESMDDETTPNDGFPIGPWIANDDFSRWISPPDINGATDAVNEPGDYFYQTMFSIPAHLDATNAAIVGWWSMDDTGTDILVNGVSISPAASTGFGSRSWFGFNSASASAVGADLEADENSIIFQVANGGDGPNPTGLRVGGIYAEAAPIGSQRIPGLYNTGVDNNHQRLADGLPDTHYEVTEAPEGAILPAVALGGIPSPPWVQNSSSSRWIGPANDQAGNAPSGEYSYELTFDLTGLDPTSVVISGLWSVDNDDQGLGILLNGETTGNNQVGGFPQLSRFDLSTEAGHEFNSELNTLTFPVFNAPPDNNPIGLRVEGLVAYAFPLGNGLLGDFNDDNILNEIDIDALMNEVADGTNDELFDLNDDGFVNDADRDAWLAEAGPANGFAGAFLLGDSNLDGIVDAVDLNALALTWNSDNKNWTEGNFTGAGSNVTDLNSLALNWNQSVANAIAVPEPNFGFILWVIFAFLCRRSSCTRSRETVN